jgi:hypothetical protein
MFATVATRPDIAAAVGMLARHVERPGQAHWTAVKRVFRYLQGTRNFGITYRRNATSLNAYCDADWAGDVSDRKSTSGFVLMLSGGPVIWKSAKQKCTALSTVEAEYIAASDATREIIWASRFIQEIDPQQIKDSPITLKIDNNGARELANNSMISQRTKHIDIRYHFIRESIKSGAILLQRCPSKDMTADVLTKALPAIRFCECREEMGIKELDKSDATQN